MLLKEVDEVSGVCGLLKPAAHPEPAKNKSGLQSVYWLLCKACSEKSTTGGWVKINKKGFLANAKQHFKTKGHLLAVSAYKRR